jgi:hypothetical protein
MSKECKMRDYQNQRLNTKRYENDIKGIPKGAEKISSKKRVEEYRLNKPIKKIQEEE